MVCPVSRRWMASSATVRGRDGGACPRWAGRRSMALRHHVFHVRSQSSLTPFCPGCAGHHSRNFCASLRDWAWERPRETANSISGCQSAGSLDPRFLEEPVGSSFSDRLSVEGNAPVSLHLLCICTAFADGLLLPCLASAAARRFSMISSAFANSASIRLCVQSGPNSIARTSRLSCHWSADIRAMRAIRRSFSGRLPFCQ